MLAAICTTVPQARVSEALDLDIDPGVVIPYAYIYQDISKIQHNTQQQLLSILFN
jgi:hypothetical protein